MILRQVFRILALFAFGLLGMLLIVSYAESLSDTISRSETLRNAAEAGCVVDGQLYEQEGDC